MTNPKEECRMSDHYLSDRRMRLCAVTQLFCVALAASLSVMRTTRADEAKRTDSAGHAVVGKSLTPSGVHRSQPGAVWHLCKRDEPIYRGESVVALVDAAFAAHNGAVRLSLVPDLAQMSSLPVVESAVVFHESPGTDLDFTLERGRVEATNQHKNNEPARVRLRFRKETWDLTLAGPGTKVAAVLYGRWPRGVPFTKGDKTEDEPTADLFLFVLNGNLQLRTRTDEYALHAPPGPASFHWDSVAGPDASPARQREVPVWARTDLAAQPRAKELKDVVKRLRDRLGEKSISEALTETMHSTDADERGIAVYALAALDDLPQFVAALSDPKHEDTREVAIIALRHWIGRSPGQDMRLFQFLVQSKGYSENQAAIVLQLLHSFGESDLGRPATYETLIDYLLHDKLAIRQLAKWHLSRLVPAGKNMAYDPAGSVETRRPAYEQWKKLVPSGKLPSERKSR
jgi:hypothetical protein